MSGFRIMSIGDCEPQEESDNDRLSGELVPIISRDQFEYEAEKFLTRYCPEALDKLSKGYSYQSKYQGARYYTQFMRNSAPVKNQIEYSFELMHTTRHFLSRYSAFETMKSIQHQCRQFWRYA